MKTLRLFTSLAALSASLLSLHAQADERGRLIFEDDFQRNESDESTEEIGNGWSTNSKTRAGGNKQADLRDGTLHIYIHQTADHAVSVRHDADFQNGRVELRFMLENDKDTLGLNFADQQLKTVHAGHLFKVTLGRKKLDFNDMKTGAMNQRIYTAKKAGKHWGCPSGSIEQTQELLEMGARFIAYNADLTMIKNGLQQMQRDLSPLGFTFDNRLDATSPGL